MSTVRVIPRLDIKGPNLVKGIHLEGLRVLGKPEDFARYYYHAGADELIYQDVVASLYERNSLLDFISRTAREIFVPLTVGGGLRTLDDISAALAAGADKTAINTAAIRNPKLVEQAAMKFGSSTIVVAIEAIRQSNGVYLAHTDNGRETTDLDAIEWARQVERLGAGEIVMTSVDCEGTGQGFDIELTKTVADQVAIPVIAHGGAGNAQHVVDVVDKAGVDAVAIASILHYQAIGNMHTETASTGEGNLEFLKSGRNVRQLQPTDLAAVKQALSSSGFRCRLEASV